MDYTFQLLKILKSNLTKMQSFLSYGDGEAAVNLTDRNIKIISLLDKIKDKSFNIHEFEIQQLVDTCISLQESCDIELRKITKSYKKELNTHLIKNQLRVHIKNT